MKNSTLKSFAQLILFIGLLFGITACTGILPTKISDLENNTQYYSEYSGDMPPVIPAICTQF